jgi:hypothetical protein
VRAITVLAGTSLLVFAGVLATFDRPPEVFLIVGSVLIVVALLGTRLRLFQVGSPSLGVTIEQQAEVFEQVLNKGQPGDLKLLISTGIPVGGAEALYRGSDHVVEVTAVNTSDRPLGVSSVGLELENHRWLPGTNPSPSVESKALPAVLAPQEHASVWWDYTALREVLDEEGVQISSIIANVRDGTKRRQPVPDDWRSLS